MIIARDFHLDKLIKARHNGLVKVVTGMRRCGKSFLLNELFRNYLLSNGVKPDHIIQIALDMRRNKPLRDPDTLCDYVESRVNDKKMHYVLLDEIQMVDDFEGVLNEFLHFPDMDVYVTGSNSHFLSSDIITEFRGRGHEIRIRPLSFAEFFQARGGERQNAWNEYLLYGGLPFLLKLDGDEQKSEYLKTLFDEVYVKDIKERNRIRFPHELEQIVSILASSVGSLTNPMNLANAFRSLSKRKIGHTTIAKYCRHLENAFLVSKAKRYDIKGKRYISTPYKYYFEDIGLRNAHLNFRQHEENHLMENVIFNELKLRGYNVDVGIVETRQRKEDGRQFRIANEIDFVANLGNKRYYVQSAFSMPDAEKREQENRPLRNTGDSFKKIIVTGDGTKIWRNNDGHTIMNIQDFLLNPNSLDL